MRWFWFAIITLLCWSGSDFFSKIGCRDSRDKYSQFKMVMAVGVVMGLHAAFEIFINGVTINWHIILTYLPVSLLYILSMALGYVGLRYIELSISSPICNASGALVAILSIIAGTAGKMEPPQYIAIALACVGVIGLGFIEATEDKDLRAARQEASNYKYAKSWLALALPVAYCILDAAGTFSDSIVLGNLSVDFIQNNAPAHMLPLFQNGIPEEFSMLSDVLEAAELDSFTALFQNGNDLIAQIADSNTAQAILQFINTNQLTPAALDETVAFIGEMEEASASSANVAYELTFLISGIFCFIYTVIIKRQKLVPKMETPKYIGAIFETAGQFTYIFAVADEAHIPMSAPIISSYCVASVLWSRIFLKEKLSWKHYTAIFVTVAGIIIMGVYDM